MTDWELQTATSRGKTIAKNGLNNNENFQSLAREQSTYTAVKKIQTIQTFVCLLRKIVTSVFFSFFSAEPFSLRLLCNVGCLRSW